MKRYIISYNSFFISARSEKKKKRKRKNIKGKEIKNKKKRKQKKERSESLIYFRIEFPEVSLVVVRQK